MSEPSAPPTATIPFHYLKSSQFRVVFAEGAVGGATPRGHIAFALYNERQAIPRLTEIDFNGSDPSPERVIEGRPGIVREVEVEVIMDLAAAQAFHTWFGERLAELRTLIRSETA